MRWAFGLLAICLAMVRSNPQDAQPTVTQTRVLTHNGFTTKTLTYAQSTVTQRRSVVVRPTTVVKTVTTTVTLAPTTVTQTSTQTVIQTVAGSDLCWTGSCPHNFEMIGNCCYYFSIYNSKDPQNWQGAKDQCKALGNGTKWDIDLFEVGTGGCTGDVNLMIRIADIGVDTHTGAKSVDSGANWLWARTGKPFPNNCNMWWHGDPRTDNRNCMHAFVNDHTNKRALFGIASCDTEINNYVCQIFN